MYIDWTPPNNQLLLMQNTTVWYCLFKDYDNYLKATWKQRYKSENGWYLFFKLKIYHLLFCTCGDVMASESWPPHTWTHSECIFHGIPDQKGKGSWLMWLRLSGGQQPRLNTFSAWRRLWRDPQLDQVGPKRWSTTVKPRFKRKLDSRKTRFKRNQFERKLDLREENGAKEMYFSTEILLELSEN